MKRHLVLAVLTLAAAAGCRDLPRQATPTEPETRAESAAPSRSTGEAGTASTVCESYGEQLGSLRTELAQNPADSGLSEQVAAFEAIISDVCDG
jgi:hypothetical protein